MAPQQVDYLHFLLVPLMSQSHLIPFVDVAKQLAARGHTVTLHLTPLNALRFRSVADETLANPNLKIQFLILAFPGQEAGLPEGCENMDSLPSPDFVSNFFDATNLLQGPLEDWLETARPRPNCLVSDICLPWTADLGLRFNIPRILFHGISCFTMLCSHNIDKFMADGKVLSDSEPFRVPDMPDEIFFTKAQLPETRFRDGACNADMEDLLNKFKAAEKSADGVIVNSFEELEPNYVKGYQAVVKRLWCIGPVSLCNTNKSSKADRGNKSAIDENLCLKWLDSRNSRSVLYVCFGSLCHVLASQLIELALGLESSGCSFMWVIKKGDYSEELENWLKEERYEERVKGKGIIIRGWAPQVLILSHAAVGGFMTHCGWNSTLEGVAAGVPMITWPMFAEQFYNEKLIVQVAGAGVGVGVERCINWGEEEEVGVLVRSEDVRAAIERLMDGGEEAEKRRRRARILGEAAKRTVEEGGSSYRETFFPALSPPPPMKTAPPTKIGFLTPMNTTPTISLFNPSCLPLRNSDEDSSTDKDRLPHSDEDDSADKDRLSHSSSRLERRRRYSFEREIIKVGDWNSGKDNSGDQNQLLHSWRDKGGSRVKRVKREIGGGRSGVG